MCKKVFSVILLIVLLLMVGGLLYLRSLPWNPEDAASYATKNAEPRSVGLCAKYVRKSMVAGGLPLHVGVNAWHYKYLLPILGFEEIDKDARRNVGDIVVFQPIGRRRFGHIAIWNGRQWVSDFKQRSIIVHRDYRRDECEYAIFRKE